MRKLYYQIVVNIHPVILGDLFSAYLADIFPKLKDFLMTDEFKFKNPKLWLQQAKRLKLQMEGIFHIGEYYYYGLYEAAQAF